MSQQYRVELAGPVAKQLRKLEHTVRRRVLLALHALSDDPRPAGARKLVGTDTAWRIRVGDFRVIYEVDDAILTVLVVRVGHRREVYDR